MEDTLIATIAWTMPDAACEHPQLRRLEYVGAEQGFHVFSAGCTRCDAKLTVIASDVEGRDVLEVRQ